METPPRSFICLRHGVTDWNRQGRFQGRTDVPLNDDGILQAHAAALRLQNTRLDQIVASPLVRAVKTAEIVATSSSVPLAIDDGIIECDFGSLEGRSITEVMKENDITEMGQLTTILPPDGEPWAAVSVRSLACVSRWLERHPQSVILFVCHDAVMQSMAEALCGHWFENRHATPFRFQWTGDLWTLHDV